MPIHRNNKKLNGNELFFNSQIILLIEKQMRTRETILNDLLELCEITYYKMFKNKIPIKKLYNIII